MSTWLQRIVNRLGKGSDTEASAKISEHFFKRSLYATSDEFLNSLLRFFPHGGAIDDGQLRVLLSELRGLWGPERALVEGDLGAQLAFWQELARRCSSPHAMACHADTLLLSGREADAIAVFLEAVALDPQLLDEFGEDIAVHARRLGGSTWLHFQLAGLRVSIDGIGDRDSDAIREVYSELLEEFSTDSDALLEIRRVGEVLEDAVERGAMPRAMVIRGPSRTSN